MRFIESLGLKKMLQRVYWTITVSQMLNGKVKWMNLEKTLFADKKERLKYQLKFLQNK